jgi:hypothetical protein
MATLDNLLRPETIAIIKAAGLHRVVGEIAGVGELHPGKVAGLLGARSFVRRKTARLVASGILSLAAATGERLSDDAERRIRDTVSPVRGA